jgi:hypothetical protein
MKKTVAFMLPWLVLTGCGTPVTDDNKDGVADGIRNPDNVSVVAPSTPKGTVSGQVLTTRLTPLSEATVDMTIGSASGRKATTDANGNFSFDDVPAGAQILLTISKPNFATLRATSTVPSSAGNIPINNGNASFGPVALAELNGSVRFALVLPNGRPAVNARATLEAVPSGAFVLNNGNIATSSVVSSVVVSGVSNDQGIITFTGLPTAAELDRIGSYLGGAGGRYRLWVDPVDANTDSNPETGGYTETINASAMLTGGSLRVIRLPYPQNASQNFSILASNIEVLRDGNVKDPVRNMVRSGEPLFITFNHPLQQGSWLVLLTNESGSQLLPATTSVGGLGNVLTVTPGNTVTFQEGQEYNIHVRAVSAQTGELLAVDGFFFAGNVASPMPLALSGIAYQETSAVAPARLDRGEVVYLTFNQGVEARTAGQVVEVFIDADIDNNGVIGNARGERGNARGVLAYACEPSTHLPGPALDGTAANLPTNAFAAPVFPFGASGYTTRLCFTYTSGGAVTASLNPDTTTMYVRFDLMRTRTTNLYETIWGSPIISEFNARTAAIPAPPP